MVNKFNFLCLLMLLVAGSVCAQMNPVLGWTPGNPDEVALPVAIIPFGQVDEAMMDRAHAWVESNLAIKIDRFGSRPDIEVGTFDEAAQSASEMLEDNRVGIVVMWMPSSDIMNHGAHFPEKRVVIANIQPMYQGENIDDEIIGRRIERQAIRGVSLLMGLEPSPIPQSVMFAYSSRDELDQIGRNLDPPWLIRLQRRALELGFELDRHNPNNMINPFVYDEVE
ncbi:MAG TPA: hypothetical protein PJ991_02295 [Kiritimatiellia bacterium]|nr:hypothetical protein [Kiritimatiellia bacterium]